MWSLCVPNPEIGDVLSLESGLIQPAPVVIGADYGRAEELRMKLAEENSTGHNSYVCPICRVGVYLCVNRTEQWGKRFYFKHRIEDGNCPAITRGTLSKEEIEARKYNGVKESAPHIRMKEILAESLAQDRHFSEIETEPRWPGDGGAWRKPDVRATLDGQIRVAFEIQLSTTFLHVIAERRLFYQEQGALLCWVFAKFDPEDALMTQDDIFYNNNRNLFLASEETLATSKQTSTFVLDCHWHEPLLEGGSLRDSWNDKVVAFTSLHLDSERQRVYFYDYDANRACIADLNRHQNLAARFADWWASHRFPAGDQAWMSFRQEFRLHGVELPEYPNKLTGLLNAVYSAKAGKAVGWIHPKFISVAHTVAGSHPEALQQFLAALSVYGQNAKLKAEDSLKPGTGQGKWEARLETCRNEKAAGDERYNRNRAYDPLVAFLFAEVWAKLQTWDAIPPANEAAPPATGMP